MAAFSVMLPFVPTRPEQAVPFASLVQWSTARRLWQGQSVLVEPHQMFAFLAAAGFRIPVGVGVTLMPFRHPIEAALQARSLAATMGAPVVAGYGPGATILQANLRGAPYPSPLTAVREYLTIVRALLDRGVADVDGEYFSMRGGLPPWTGLDVELGLGVLRPRMARLAGELADVAITWLTPPAYLSRHIVPALREGAAAAGRPPPRLVAMVPVALRTPDRDPVDLAMAGNAAHLRLPQYCRMLRAAGLDVDENDPRAGARALVEAGVFVCGEPDVIVKELDAYRAAGVDEIVVNVTGMCHRFGARAALAELRTIFDTLEEAS
jgi:5,10-methylenetetrahydromethanopterin reductase